MAATIEQELDTLRQTNSELVAKAAQRKDRIAELEAEVAGLQTKLTEQDAAHK